MKELYRILDYQFLFHPTLSQFINKLRNKCIFVLLRFYILIFLFYMLEDQTV